MVIGETFRRIVFFFLGDFLVKRYFSSPDLAEIQAQIARSEKEHSAEICFAIEPSLDLPALLRKTSPRERALQVFSNLRVWDTEQNSGVLIYLLLSHHQIEIVADRGVQSKLAAGQLETICAHIEQKFKQNCFLAGVRETIETIDAILLQHFPQRPGDKNELSDRPVIL